MILLVWLDDGQKFSLMFFLCYSDVKSCSPSNYKCGNGKCVSKVNPECDGVKDCYDGSDERRCGNLLTSKLY